MTTRQGELRRIVIKRCGPPCRRCVTGLAVQTEIPCNVVWIHGSLEVSLVALSTIRIHKLVVAVRMTYLTGLSGMRSR